MIIIFGLIVLLVAVVVGITGVLINSAPDHPEAGYFGVFGYHITGSTGTLFLAGIVIGRKGPLTPVLPRARRTKTREVR